MKLPGRRAFQTEGKGSEEGPAWHAGGRARSVVTGDVVGAPERPDHTELGRSS